MSTILIAEQDLTLRRQLADRFRQYGHLVTEACGGFEAIQHLERRLFEAIITDLRLPEKTGLDILQTAKAADESTLVLMLVEPEDAPCACEWLKLGSDDYLCKADPINLDEVSLRLERALEYRRLRQAVSYLRRAHPYLCDGEHLISHSTQLQHILNRFQRDIATNAHAIILGEAGTGKGVFAAAIHAHSPRREQTFVTVDCAALPERDLESELFGHESGAFPGLHSRHIGGFELAHRGTLFLQHVGGLSPRIQTKVLRVLRERTMERLGSTRTINVDVRVVASTTFTLAEAVRARRFRADLYRRLNMLSVNLPALRQCPEDILSLAQVFLQHYNRLFGRRVKRFDESVQRALMDYSWPGNLRELECTIAHAVYQETGDTMSLSSRGGRALGVGAGVVGDSSVRLPAAGIPLKEIERQTLLQAMQRTNWVQKDAAALLDITPRVMHYKLKTHGITPPRRSPRR